MQGYLTYSLALVSIAGAFIMNSLAVEIQANTVTIVLGVVAAYTGKSINKLIQQRIERCTPPSDSSSAK